MSRGYFNWAGNWDLSWIVTSAFGARNTGAASVLRWAEPLLASFCAGAWRLIWTPDTVLWEAKPVVHTEPIGNGRRLHNASGPALENEIENLYFLQGVLVPADVVLCPENLTVEHIDAEDNQEVRRLMIERFAGVGARADDGWLRYIGESGASVRHHQFNERDQQRECLFAMKDGRKMVVLSDPSTARRYALGVPREVDNCEQAQRFLSHGLDRHLVVRT